MPDEPEDLWPVRSFSKVQDPEPVRLLKQQAALLAEKTDGIVEGIVVETPTEGSTYYNLYLSAPSLGDYMHQLAGFWIPIDSPIDDPYPIELRDNLRGTNSYSEAKDSEQFKSWLKAVLSSAKTQAVVTNMLRRAKNPV